MFLQAGLWCFLYWMVKIKLTIHPSFSFVELWVFEFKKSKYPMHELNPLIIYEKNHYWKLFRQSLCSPKQLVAGCSFGGQWRYHFHIEFGHWGCGSEQHSVACNFSYFSRIGGRGPVYGRGRICFCKFRKRYWKGRYLKRKIRVGAYAWRGTPNAGSDLWKKRNEKRNGTSGSSGIDRCRCFGRSYTRRELGVNEISEARPTQAALASGAAFIVGGPMPILVVLLFPFAGLAYWLYELTTFFLMVLGIVAAKTGGSKVWKSMLRIAVWGSIAMGLSAGVGYLFGVNV